MHPEQCLDVFILTARNVCGASPRAVHGCHLDVDTPEGACGWGRALCCLRHSVHTRLTETSLAPVILPLGRATSVQTPPKNSISHLIPFTSVCPWSASHNSSVGLFSKVLCDERAYWPSSIPRHKSIRNAPNQFSPSRQGAVSETSRFPFRYTSI